MKLPLLIFFLVEVAVAADVFECPVDESTGKFIDPFECDKYWDCFRGVATERYCKDGWAFDPRRIQLAEPCDYIFNVDCRGRELLGDPLGTGVCKRENGIYPHDDPEVCGRYFSCSDNRPIMLHCSPGLHFNLEINACDWPSSANRGNCGARASIGNFSCDPSKEYFTRDNQKIAHPNFPDPNDCVKFFVCKNGVEPAISACSDRLVFNERISACDIPENVPECADWFEFPVEKRRRRK